MSNWREHVRKVVPYVPGEQPNKPGMIKLNTNENPYPPAPGVQKVLDEFSADSLRLYPDPAVTELTTCLADYYGVGKDQVFVGVGSDDVLAMAFMTFFNSEKPILFPDISYSFYSVWAEEFRIPYKRPALDENFKLVKEDFYQENGGIIFPNPNAPTAIFEPLSTIEEILQHNKDVVVIVDEAYIDFGGQSAMSLVDKYDNLLVVQTFSKSRSMAGMRNRSDDHCYKQIAVQIVTRLQQCPNRYDRRYHNIHEHRNMPYFYGKIYRHNQTNHD